MLFVLARQKTREPNAWRAAFKSQQALRGEAGCRSELVLADSQDPHDTFALLAFEDPERLRAYMASAELQQALADAQVVREEHYVLLPMGEHGGAASDTHALEREIVTSVEVGRRAGRPRAERRTEGLRSCLERGEVRWPMLPF